jgi:hypothetical protein
MDAASVVSGEVIETWRRGKRNAEAFHAQRAQPPYSAETSAGGIYNGMGAAYKISLRRFG